MPRTTFALAATLLALGGATAAHAQAAPAGEELFGQTVEVRSADGTVNTIAFRENGTATISGSGVDPVEALWGVEGNQLCMQVGGASECWNYAQRFKAMDPVNLSSSCNTVAQWTALSVAPTQEAAPLLRERG